ncbi:MAG TPA: nucleotidyltransferase family protein [Gaiellaceae bacterium]|nr:nucleotidyltransferase family protein [Gaiellaceae bacterium]
MGARLARRARGRPAAPRQRVQGRARPRTGAPVRQPLHVAVVILAAGAATRFGAPKQRLLLPRVLERVRTSEVDEVVVVSGAYALDTDARVVECPDWQLGPGASLRCGLEALGPEVEAAVVVLADGPDLAPAAIDRVLMAWRKSGADVVAASYAGDRGHPVLLARRAWAAIPDEGARALEPLLVPCDDLGPPGDVDSADEWEEEPR